MKYPSCSETLLMTDKKGIEIDYCSNCRGIWLDRGELEKIIKRSADHYSKKENYDSDYKRYGYGEYDDDYQKRHPHKKRNLSLTSYSTFRLTLPVFPFA